MKEKEVKMLAELRKYVIEEYNGLNGGDNPSAMVKQTDVAYSLESIVRSLDHVLSEYVKFE